jgi:hypothetical protein
MDGFERFIENLRDNPRASEVAARLKRQGVDLRRVFAALTVYAENRSIAPERKRRGKQHREIVNRGVRNGGMAPEVARWLLDRGELAHSTVGFSRAHNVDSLAWLVLYLEAVTAKHVSASELAYLVEAANRALELKPFDVDPETIGRELRRYRQNKNNHPFLEILRKDVLRNL